MELTGSHVSVLTIYLSIGDGVDGKGNTKGPEEPHLADISHTGNPETFSMVLKEGITGFVMVETTSTTT